MTVDLHVLLSRLGWVPGHTGEMSSGGARESFSGRVELIDTAPREVGAAPLEVTAWVDGVQAYRPVTWRSGRPVVVAWVAAGGLSPDDGTLVGPVSEKLWVLCGRPDHDEILGLVDDLGLAVEPVGADEPPEVEALIPARVSDARDGAERDTIQRIARTGGIVAVDGSIRTRGTNPRLVGVVKTHRTRYLADERVLWDLPAGWMSPRFRVHDTDGSVRCAAYVRVVGNRRRPWWWGLVRVEARDPGLLEPLAALCGTLAQGPGSEDPRWDRHLAPVAAVERVLRARRPPALF